MRCVTEGDIVIAIAVSYVQACSKEVSPGPVRINNLSYSKLFGHQFTKKYSVFESFEDNAAQE